MLEPSAAREPSRLRFYAPLVEAVEAGTAVYRYFKPSAVALKSSTPDAAKLHGIGEVTVEKTAEKQADIELVPLNRQLVVVMEGAGDWVEKAYRTAFARAMKESVGSGLFVFYADDTRWKHSVPGWVTDLKPWEAYLDKATAHDFAIYLNLRPDVVFIVTPDFTHSSLARGSLGKSPLIFIEKPFDSRLANVLDLFVHLAQERGTAVVGLDHWLAYALPLQTLKTAIVEHFDGALAEVTFYMAEDRPIERGRDRSLQFGLTLDLLPHLLALLTHFGDIASIDEIRVDYAGQYQPLVATDPASGASVDISGRYHSETASAVSFTFEDYSGNGYRIPCRAIACCDRAHGTGQ